MVKIVHVWLAAGLMFTFVHAQEQPRSAEVFLAEYPAAVRGGQVDAVAVRRMVDSLVMAAAGRDAVAAAWRVFVRPQDRVGIKVSTSGAPVSSTHPAVVAAVAEGLAAAGVSPENIVIWDRKGNDVTRAGYGSLGRRFVVTATDRAGYDEKETVMAAVMGTLIAGDHGFDGRDGPSKTSSKSHLSSVLGSVDKVIHLPALTDHLSSGLNGAISGMVLDNLDNWRRLARPPHFGDPFLPELYADPRLGGKVVLTILDALRPQYGGGPFPGPQYVVNHGAIYASRDPVSIDALGLQLIDRLRSEGGLPLLAKQIEWIRSAETIGLGVADTQRIRIVPTRAGP